MDRSIPEPWDSFLHELDDYLQTEVTVVCIGGFVLSMLHGLERPTSDIDFISCRPKESRDSLLGLAGEGERLHRKHGVFFQSVTVAQLPHNYEDRLSTILEGEFNHLQMQTIGPYDLALTKLERNSEKDRDDVLLLASANDFRIDDFKNIYEEEFKMYVEDRLLHRTTFDFWLHLIDDYKNTLS